MKQMLTILIGTTLLFVACKKSSGDKFTPTTGPLPTPTPAANFRGLTATINGVTMTADPTTITVRRRPADPGLGTLPYIVIMGRVNKQRMEVEIAWTGAQPQPGTYPLYYQRSSGRYLGKMYYSANTDLDPSGGQYFSTPSVDSAVQRGKIVVTVVDDHKFVGAYSAIARSTYTGETKEIMNGQFGADY